MTDQPAAPKPFRHRRDGLTPERQAAFCAALRTTGFVAHAARLIGISVNSCRRARDRMPAFAQAWDEAQAAARAPDRAAPAEEPLHLVLRRQAMAKLAAGESGAATLLKLAMDAERAAAAQQAAAVPRVTAAQTDASILRKLSAMDKQRKRHLRAEQLAWCERMEREGKAP